MNKIKAMVLAATLLVVGCSSVAPILKPSSVLENPKQHFRVRLESKGQIAVIQKITKGNACSEARRKLKVSLKSNNKKEVILVKYSCDVVPNALVAYTKSLNKGLYQVKVEGNQKAHIATGYDDPDFNAGKKKDFTIAEELNEGKTVKNNVNQSLGQASQWVSVKSKGSMVSLLLNSENPQDIKGTIYSLPKGSKMPQRIGFLKPGVKSSISSDQGDILVQISGKKYTGETKYALSRKDVTVTNTVSVPVIDCYPVSTSQSIVLLNPTAAIKVNDELNISAKKLSGETVLLGKCIVGSISDSQASCRLNTTVTKDLGRFRAEKIKEG